MASLSILFLKTASCFLRNKRATLEKMDVWYISYPKILGPKYFIDRRKKNGNLFIVPTHDHLVSLSLAVELKFLNTFCLGVLVDLLLLLLVAHQLHEYSVIQLLDKLSNAG